jgi:hypothetical protein
MMQEHDPDAMQALKDGDAEAEKTNAAMEKNMKTYDPNDPEEEAVEAAEAEGADRSPDICALVSSLDL